MHAVASEEEGEFEGGEEGSSLFFFGGGGGDEKTKLPAVDGIGLRSRGSPDLRSTQCSVYFSPPSVSSPQASAEPSGDAVTPPVM